MFLLFLLYSLVEGGENTPVDTRQSVSNSADWRIYIRKREIIKEKSNEAMEILLISIGGDFKHVLFRERVGGTWRGFDFAHH